MALTSTELEAARPFSSPQEEVLINLMRSAECLHRAFQQRLRPFGLTAAQYNVLRMLRSAQPNGLTCSAIGRSMIAPEPDITRLLARLKANKLVSQQRDPQDRRVLWTRISDAGLDVLLKLDTTVERAPRELLRQLNCDEVRELTRLLKKARCCEESNSAPSSQAPPVLYANGKPPSPRPPRLHPHPE